MRRVVWLLAVLGVAGLLVAGCGGGGGGGGDDLEPDSTVFGVWMPVYMEVDGVVTPVYNGMDFPLGATHMTLEFRADETATQNFLDVNEGVVETGEGTWFGMDQEGWVQFDDLIEFDYFSYGYVLDVNFINDDEDPVLLRFVRIAELTERDPTVMRSWYVSQAWVNGTLVPITTILGSPAGTDQVVLQPRVGGMGFFRELDDHQILRRGTGTWWCQGQQLLVDGVVESPALSDQIRAISDMGGAHLTFLSKSGDTIELSLLGYGWENDPQDPALCTWWYAVGCTRDAAPGSLSDYFDWPAGITGQGILFFADGSVEASRYNPAWCGGEYGQFGGESGSMTINFGTLRNYTYTATATTLVTTDTESEPGHTWVVKLDI